VAVAIKTNRILFFAERKTAAKATPYMESQMSLGSFRSAIELHPQGVDFKANLILSGDLNLQELRSARQKLLCSSKILALRMCLKSRSTDGCYPMQKDCMVR
jgi:hypothetical protein